MRRLVEAIKNYFYPVVTDDSAHTTEQKGEEEFGPRSWSGGKTWAEHDHIHDEIKLSLRRLTVRLDTLDAHFRRVEGRLEDLEILTDHLDERTLRLL